MKQGGYTLIELLVVISVFAIATSLGVTAYKDWIKNAQVRQVAEALLSGLQSARTTAIARNTGVLFSLTNTGWSVDVIGNQTYGVLPANVQSWSYPVAPAAAISGQSIAFTPFGMASNLPQSGVTFITSYPQFGACQTISTAGVRCLSVQVLPGGNTRICDPLLSFSTNPQGC